ncbi:hypothetical protein BS17DRAFT_117114 [Gyrodon lividus]|nr:hypothetical protein BS17DRAFT_117114 [Gyrodon lividus]
MLSHHIQFLSNSMFLFSPTLFFAPRDWAAASRTSFDFPPFSPVLLTIFCSSSVTVSPCQVFQKKFLRPPFTFGLSDDSSVFHLLTMSCYFPRFFSRFWATTCTHPPPADISSSLPLAPTTSYDLFCIERSAPVYLPISLLCHLRRVLISALPHSRN